MKEPENKVYIDLSTGQVMAYKDTLISSQLYALFQDEFIEKLAGAIVNKIDERNKDGKSENLQPTCNQLATDLINRQEAIKAICEDGTWLESQGCTEITMAERKQRDADILGELPSAQPEILACGEGELNVPDTNVGDMINRQAAIEAITAQRGVVDKSVAKRVLAQLPSAQPEPFTDEEQRMFLSAMGREEHICKHVDAVYEDPYEDSLVRICHEIKRKVKGALWT